MDASDKIPGVLGPPFDDADADLTLRSSDMVDFHVCKSVVCKVSPSLMKSIQDLNMDTESSESSISNRPILTVPESSKVLRTLLSTFLLVPIDLPDSFEDMTSVLATAQNYEMESSISVLSKLVRGGSDQPWTIRSIDPFKAYFIACRYGLKEEAVFAAHLTLVKSFTIEQCIECELQYASGPQLYALWRYRDDASKASRRWVRRFCTHPQYQHLWMSDEPGTTRCDDSATDELLEGLRAYFLTVSGTIPCVDPTAFGKAMSKHAWNSGCVHCQEIPSHVVQRFWAELDKVIANAADEVKFSTKSLDTDIRSRTSTLTAPSSAFARTDADIILRSSDHVDFAVYKAMLAMASPFFRSMFSLPTPAEPQGAGPPVCQMTEDSNTLNILLSLVFPVDAIFPTTLEDAYFVLAAAQKYDMESTMCLLRVLLRGGNDVITSQNAFRAYGLGYRYGLRDEAARAARLTLDLPMTFNDIGRDLNAISGRALSALWEYRSAYLKAQLDCYQKASEPTSSLYVEYRSPFVRCSAPTQRSENPLPMWWSCFFKRMAARTFDVAQSITKHDTLRDEFCAAIPAAHLAEGGLFGCQSCHAIKQNADAICSSLKNQSIRNRFTVKFAFDD